MDKWYAIPPVLISQWTIYNSKGKLVDKCDTEEQARQKVNNHNKKINDRDKTN